MYSGAGADGSRKTLIKRLSRAKNARKVSAFVAFHVSYSCHIHDIFTHIETQ